MLAQREKPDVEPGTIIDQVPHSGQRIKPHQSVFLEVAQQPKKLSAPPFIGLSLLDAQKRAGADRIRLKVWTVPDIAPRDTIIAQSPRAEKQLDVPQVTLYVSKGSVTTLRLVPDFKGVPLSSAEAHLKKEGVGVSSNTSADRLAEETIVLSQKPLAGSIVDLSKPTSVQLQG
ncbi:TPA: hypothetical protein DDZ86_02610 [Candidatus Dependentiae bacterium]|nr:hypothetical protein [Candidatus Dependentiae bacterium]